MGLGGVAIAILPSIICLKLTFSDGLGNVLLRQKRDEVPEGTLSCPNRNLANSHRHCHNEGGTSAPLNL